MIFYTADLHLGHSNIIRICDRPFDTVEEMDETLIANWNRKVGAEDTVYLLGDVMYRNTMPPEEYLYRLNGKKHLVVGNHDWHWMRGCEASDWFEGIYNLHYITDGHRCATICHYPMMSWPRMLKSYMIHGHIHNNVDAFYWPLIHHSALMLNAGVDINNFEPVTLDELIENNIRYKNSNAP